MNPPAALIFILAVTVLAFANPEVAGGSLGSRSSSGVRFGGQQRRPYGPDIISGEIDFGKQRLERSPEGQYGGRGGYEGSRGGFGGGRGGFNGSPGGFGGGSYAIPQQTRIGLPYGTNTGFGGGFGSGRWDYGEQNIGFGRNSGQFGY